MDKTFYTEENPIRFPYAAKYEGEEKPYSGFCKLTLNDGTVVELEGSGELNYQIVGRYSSYLAKAEIGKLCTSIAYGTFYNISNLVEVMISNTVTSIGISAFNGCSSLVSVNIPSSVTSIKQATFYGCTSLTTVAIPNSVTTIGPSAFLNCSSLISVTIPNSVTSIENTAFINCSGLVSIIVSDSMASFGNAVFFNCSGLTNITILATTPPTLGQDVFANTNDAPIYVPAESVEVYKANWSQYTNRIQPITQ